MRISVTTLESFRLFMEQDWMPEESLQATIRGEFAQSPKMALGKAFGQILEAPDAYDAGVLGYECDGLVFPRPVVDPCLAIFDRRGVFEAKALKTYGEHVVVAKADQLLGARLIENKTTLSYFDFNKYADSYQWRFYADIFQPTRITYNVFCLDQGTDGVITLRGVESFDLYPYHGVRSDCEQLVGEFVRYVRAKGLACYLERPSGLEAA